jgi:hypothetical protein
VKANDRFVFLPHIVELSLPDAPEPWAELGFAVEDGHVDIGGVRLRLNADALAWRLSGIGDAVSDIDGLPTTVAEGLSAGAVAHPNGAAEVDHVVVFSPDFDRTVSALEAVGVTLSRIRDGGGFRQGFRRLGPAILELVEAKDAPPGPARFWGLVVAVEDLRGLADRLGDRLTPIKAAVQSGRHIATLRRSSGLSLKLAFMDPDPRSR